MQVIDDTQEKVLSQLALILKILLWILNTSLAVNFHRIELRLASNFGLQGLD